MPQSWSDASEKRLLLAVITVLDPSPPNWDDVAALMGPGYTPSGLRQKFTKIRKAVDGEDVGSKPSSGGAAAQKTTPAKRGRGPTAGENVGKRGKKVKVKAEADADAEAEAEADKNEDENEDEDEDENENDEDDA